MINKYTNYSLLPHNTFGIDVKAACFIEYDTSDELLEIINSGGISKPYMHIGEGSNLLFLRDYEGTVLHSRINTIEVVEEDNNHVILKAGAGVCWDDFVAYCVEHSWYGAENLSLIPGEVGSSVIQNIGAYGVEVKDILTAADAINIKGESKRFNLPQDGYFSYRYSIFKEPSMKEWFITYAYFRLSKHEHYNLTYGSIREETAKYPQITLGVVRQAITNIRNAKLPDPKVYGNAGSFFMNCVITREKFNCLLRDYPNMPFTHLEDGTVKIPTAWLIDQCGWKGKALGAAAVHDKQPLVLINKGGARGHEVVALSDAIRVSVKDKFGIEINPEVNIIG